MKINPGKSKSVSFTTASVKDPLNYSFGDQKISEASSFKYLGIIICRDLSRADQVNYTVQKAWKALHFMCMITKGNSKMKSLAYKSLVHPILQYGAVCRDPYRKGQAIVLDRVQKKAINLQII
jgi:hypothetical protein